MQKQQEALMKTQKNYRIFGPVATEFDSTNIGSWRLERPRVNFSECIKCKICQNSCPVDVMTVHKDKDECVIIDWNYCKGCGICANECPKKCISMVDERSEK